jgi:hypothetical protein
VPEKFVRWAIGKLRNFHQEESSSRQLVVSNLEINLNSATRKLDNLLSKYLSDANQTGELISDEEYRRQKELLKQERERIEDQIKSMGIRQDAKMANLEEKFELAYRAKYWLENGGLEKKRSILNGLGSNLALNAKKLEIDLDKTLTCIRRVAPPVNAPKEWIEPKNLLVTVGNKDFPELQNLKWGE